MSNEPTVYEGQSRAVEAYRMSTDAAAMCKAIVVASAQLIGGKKYVKVEGWQAIAIAHGCVASSRDVEIVEGGIRAIGQVHRMSDGALISQAEGFVGEDETMWAGRPEYARRAMAQTRAISRACRSAFAHVVVMMNAGLSTTPAEEVPAEGFKDSYKDKPPISAPKTKTQAQSEPKIEGNTVTGIVETVSVKTGKGKKGDWTKYGIKIGKEWYGTFDKEIGADAEALKGTAVSLTWEPDGDYKTCKSIEAQLAESTPPPVCNTCQLAHGCEHDIPTADSQCMEYMPIEESTAGDM